MSLLSDMFEMSVVISAVDKFTAPMKKIEDSMKYSQGNIDKITKSMKNMGMSSGDIDKVTNSLDKLQRNNAWAKLAKDLKDAGVEQPKIDQMAQGFERLAAQQDKMEKMAASFDKFKKVAVTGGVVTGIGFTMAEGLAHATDEAGKLLTVLTTIQDASGANNSQMSGIRNTIMNTSAVTRYGIMDTANIAQILSTSGYDANQVNSLLPTFTKFAEVQQYGKGAAPDESVKQAIELAHGFGKYSPDELNQFLNMYNKGTFLQPEDSAKFGETLKYSMTTGKTLGMSDNDIVYMSALANRMGLAGSMGGTNAADMLMRSIPGISGGMQRKKDGTFPKQLQAMMDLGLADSQGNTPFFTNGKITDLAGFMDSLYTHTKDLTPEKKYQAFHDIFGIQGNRFASLISSQQGQEQLAALHAGQNRISGIDKMQEDYLKTPEGQINQLKSNLDNLKFNVFLEMAKALNPFVENLNKLVEKVIQFSEQHPKIAQYVATFALISTGLLLIAGPITSVIGLIGMLVTGLRLVRIAVLLWQTAQWLLNVALDANPIGLIIIAIGALVAAIVWCIYHWDLVKAAAERVWQVFKNNPILWFVGGPITMLIGAIAGIIANWDAVKVGISDGWGAIKNSFIDGVDFVVGKVNTLIDILNKIPGVSIGHLNGIGGQVMTSAIAAQRGLSDNQARRAFGMVNGSHASGLWNVPFDGYIAELHKGERVLTANQASQSRYAETNPYGASGGGNTINIYASPQQSAYEIGQEVDRILSRRSQVQARNSGISVNRSAF